MKENGAEIILREDFCETKNPLTSPILHMAMCWFLRLTAQKTPMPEYGCPNCTSNDHVPGACKVMQYNVTPEGTSKKFNKTITVLLMKLYRDTGFGMMLLFMMEEKPSTLLDCCLSPHKSS
ncbi:hypothetical protein L1049_016185 [Liquidambar formosana]|uniref:Uncharacterized protein n=1 Tax=Liquidambar formosana TaxID=63359 RepID=A0AAP0RYV4_LIQFO